MRLMIAHVWLGRGRQDYWGFFRCQIAPYSYMLGLVVLINNVFAYHLRIQEAITARRI